MFCHTLLRSPRGAAVLGVALSAVLASVASAQSQDRRVVFIHGLFGNNSTWQATGNYLASQYQIQPWYPNLGWDNTFETQATNLQNALGSFDQFSAMAWSNGGVAERRYVQQYGASTKIASGFTVGTPHRGAQLVQYVRDGTAGRYASYLFNSIADPFNFYYAWDPDFKAAMDWGPNVIIRYTMEAMAFVGYYFVPIINAVAVPVSQNIPVGAEMIPSSAFMTTLNSAGSLGIEQANMPVRVSAGTSVSPQNAFFTLFSNQPQTWGGVRRAVEYFCFGLFDYYSAHSDFFLQANAWRWLQCAQAMEYFDVDWHFLIGSVVAVTNGVVYVDHQDGLVPLGSQTWPGATVQENRLWPTYSIPHRSQITHPVMLSLMQNVVNVRFGIPVRPPPLQSSLSGPSAIEEYTNGTWSAGASGGYAPYTYQWTTDGYTSGTGGSLTDGGWGGGTSHSIALTVWDSRGNTSSHELSVYVTYAGGCIYPPCPQ